MEATITFTPDDDAREQLKSAQKERDEAKRLLTKYFESDPGREQYACDRANFEAERENFRHSLDQAEAICREIVAVAMQYGWQENELFTKMPEFLRAQLETARKDTERLDYIQAKLSSGMGLPQFWMNRNKKVSFAPWDEAKCVEGDDVRAALDAAIAKENADAE